MKSIYILLVLMIFGASSSLSHAEIYKWKDKNGAIRYSDTPPPSNVKQEAVGSKKATQSTGQPPLAPVESAKPAASKDVTKTPVSNEDAAATKRQADAEVDKKNKTEKEKQEAAKAENCKIARGNLENYTQGGRIYKMNEKGEREYVSDAGLAEGKAQAQKDIEENCN
ncbi:MAG: DUF4124 domain-containing protein [Methylotenera sp.]